MEIESDQGSSFEDFEENSPQPGEGEEVKDMHFDQVYEIDDSDQEDIPSNPDDQIPAEMQANSSQGSEFSNNSNDMMMNPTVFQQPQYKGQFKQTDSEGQQDQDGPIFQGAYNPADYADLKVQPDIQELFQYIQRYKPHHLELETTLRPFIPDYICAVGQVDAFLKIPRPDSKEETFGLEVLDEPKLNQSDPAILDLKMRSLLVGPRTSAASQVVRSIEQADKNPKQITRWIQSISDIQRNKPLPRVDYSNNMPDIETLMDVWPYEIENLLQSIELPGPDLDLPLEGYVKLVCAILDIPVNQNPNNKGMVESLHLLFSLYSDFKNNQHFKQLV